MPPTIRQKLRPRPDSGNALDNYYGWNSSMGRDVRRDPSLPHQFQYRDQGRTVVSDREPGWTDFGRNRSAPLFNQMGDSSGGFGTPNFSQPTGRPNFRAPSGIESLQEQAAVDPSDWRVIQQILNAGGDPDDYIQTADDYSLQNLIRQIENTENEDLLELLRSDIELRYPWAIDEGIMGVTT